MCNIIGKSLVNLTGGGEGGQHFDRNNYVLLNCDFCNRFRSGVFDKNLKADTVQLNCTVYYIVRNKDLIIKSKCSAYSVNTHGTEVDD